MPTPSRRAKPKVTDRRYLRPAEVRRLIEAAGKRGRYPFRDRVRPHLISRQGLTYTDLFPQLKVTRCITRSRP